MTGLDTEVQRLLYIVGETLLEEQYTDHCQFILTGAIARTTIDASECKVTMSMKLEQL